MSKRKARRVAHISIQSMSVSFFFAVEFDGRKYTVRQPGARKPGGRFLGVGTKSPTFVLVRACQPNRRKRP